MSIVERQGTDDSDLSVHLGEQGMWNLALALSSAATPLEVAGAMAERGGAAAKAQFANMALYDRPAERIRLVHAPSLDPAVTERWADLPLSVPTPLGTAIRTGQPVLLGSLDAIGRQFPNLVADTARSKLAATASLPLKISGGGVAGAVGFAWATPQTFGRTQVARLSLVADIAARALERAMVAAPRASSPLELIEARLLQDTFLPASLPCIDHLDVAAAYMPASDAPMGGDWYDAFAVDDLTCLVIGDVAGHGVRSAAVMALLRNAARAFADEDPTPARVLGRLNRMLLRLEPEETASALVATWDPKNRTLTRSHAGHLPPLWCSPGRAEFLESGTGMLLGAGAHPGYTDLTTVLTPDASLLFYTDGLVEFRTIGLTEGMTQMKTFVEGLSDLSPQGLCDQVLHWRLASGRREDDLCLLTASGG